MLSNTLSSHVPFCFHVSTKASYMDGNYFSRNLFFFPTCGPATFGLKYRMVKLKVSFIKKKKVKLAHLYMYLSLDSNSFFPKAVVPNSRGFS